MIDDKTILQWELDAEEEEHAAFLTGDVEKMELIRNARRYLALREHIANVRHFDLLLDDDDGSTIDAAADRLLEKNRE